MPDYLGNDQRKTKTEDEEDKPFQSTCFHSNKACAYRLQLQFQAKDYGGMTKYITGLTGAIVDINQSINQCIYLQ